MSEATITAPVETTAVEDTRIALVATRSRINPTKPSEARLYEEGATLYVTSNSAGRVRVAMTHKPEGRKLGDLLDTKKYGELEIIGKVTPSGRKSGQVPDANLPLRAF